MPERQHIQKDLYYMPGYTGHLAGLKADGLNIGETTHKKLEKAHAHVPLNSICTADFIQSGKVGQMPQKPRLPPEPERLRINLGSKRNSLGLRSNEALGERSH